MAEVHLSDQFRAESGKRDWTRCHLEADRRPLRFWAVPRLGKYQGEGMRRTGKAVANG